MSEGNSKFLTPEKAKSFYCFFGVSILSFLLRFPAFFIQTMIFYMFQDRDMSRAQALLDGKMIFFGPELTGGGNLPGPFYYFLLSPPIWLGLGWMGAWYWMFVLIAAGAVCGWYFIRSKYDSVTASVWLLIFSFLQPIHHLTITFFNPSFNILFLVLANILTVLAFTSEKQKVRDRSILFAFLISGLIIQIHYSGITHLLALLFLLAMAAKLRLPKPAIRKTVQGIGIFLLTLSPFLFWQIFAHFNIYLGQAQSYVGSTAGSIPSLLSYFKISTSAIQFIILCFQKLYLVLPVIFLIGIFLRYLFFSKSSAESSSLQTPEDAKNQSMLKVLLAISAFNFIPFSFYFFVPQGSRYGAPFAITMSFLAVVFIRKIFNSAEKWKKFNYAAIVALAVMVGFICYWNLYRNQVIQKYFLSVLVMILVLTAVLYWRQKRTLIPLFSFLLIAILSQTQGLVQAKLVKGIHSEGNMPVYWQWNLIWPQIYKRTGWGVEEALARTFFINHQREQSPRQAYLHFVKNLTYEANPLAKMPDGYFVTIDKPQGQDLKEWMINESIQKEIKEALISGDIVIGKYDKMARVSVAPYFVINKKQLPAYFHSAGWGYASLPEENILQSIKEPNGAIKLQQSKYLFKWNDCPDHHRYCDAGMIVDVKSDERGQYSFDVLAVGLALSQSSKWISPTWTQAWVNPYLDVTCGSETKRFQLATSVGYNRQYVGVDKFFQFPMVNNSILLPLNRHFEMTCQSNVSEMTAGFDNSLVEREYDSVTIPGHKQTLKF